MPRKFLSRKNTDAGVTHGSVAGMYDRAVEEDRPAQLGRHVALGLGELRVAGGLGHEELALVVVDDERFYWLQKKCW